MNHGPNDRPESVRLGNSVECDGALSYRVLRLLVLGGDPDGARDYIAHRYAYAYCDVLRAGRRIAVLRDLDRRSRTRSGVARFGPGALAALRAARRATPQTLSGRGFLG